ncbi:signal transduction histidine kinase [Bacillus mesophilus]|uniref:histidine kinase n=1 Tax=Bacillus mesophilus TaxID=1808955 RepID=A0A6M0Q503_9BACI|nr:sensor histidine kinase [Bacillus mesophilus]MBM7661041.1 signal transduction histidine kinase [Bacillus mesophilus]NEY71421.1 HAMP domain-containing histidine kinase [Bacillus mesophilus]
MKTEIFTRFIKDRFLTIVLYLLSTTSIITFFHLTEPVNTEIVYPISIGGFMLIVCLVIDWIRYYPTNKALAAIHMNKDEDLQPQTEEQKAFQQLINKIRGEYNRRNNQYKEQNKERLYFLSHWMHHLKTPVSVIELIINKENKSHEVNEVLEKIQLENNRLHTYIQQGLTMIRMESFENDLEVKSVDLLPALRKLINERKKECIYQSIYPSIEFEEESAYIITDPKWNDILLEQIISNAIKYSAPQTGSKKLIFQLKRKGNHIFLTIIDEGVGIPSYDLERVFHPFFTGENGRKFSNSTGIGLYLSKKIADKVGATITIKSEISKGTEVTIQWLMGKTLS